MGVLPSAALQVGAAILQQQHERHKQQMQQAQKQQQQRKPSELRPCRRAAAGVTLAQAAADAAAQRWQQQQQQQQQQEQVYDSGKSGGSGVVDGDDDELGLSLAARLERQRCLQQQGRHEQQRHLPALRRSSLKGLVVPASDIIDLASSSNDEGEGTPPCHRHYHQQEQQRRQQQPLAAIEARASGFSGRNGAVSMADEDVALMVDMGYSDSRARRALRRSLGNIGAAVELAELLGSEGSDRDSDDGEGISAAADHAASVTVPAAQQQCASKAAADVSHALTSASSDNSGAGSQCGQLHVFEDAEEELSDHLVPHVPPAAKPAAAAVASPPPYASFAALGRQKSLPWPELASRQVSEQPSHPLGRGHMAQQQRQNAVQDTAASRGTSQVAGPNQASTSDGGVRLHVDPSQLRMPPLAPRHKFAQEYDVVLVLDSREQYSRTGHASIASARAQHMAQMRSAGLAVAEAHLAAGDVAWAAVRRGAVAGNVGRLDPDSAYLLDFILERKSMPDLVSSIKDNRFSMQKVGSPL